MSGVNVVSRTQRIVVDPASSAVSVINAGPMGSTGATGPPAYIAQASAPGDTDILWIDTDDAVETAFTDALALKLNLTGGTLTGDLNVESAYPYVKLKASVAGYINFAGTDGITRNAFYRETSTGILYCTQWDASGNYVRTAFYIAPDGNIVFGAYPTFPGALFTQDVNLASDKALIIKSSLYQGRIEFQTPSGVRQFDILDYTSDDSVQIRKFNDAGNTVVSSIVQRENGVLTITSDNTMNLVTAPGATLALNDRSLFPWIDGNVYIAPSSYGTSVYLRDKDLNNRVIINADTTTILTPSLSIPDGNADGEALAYDQAGARLTSLTVTGATIVPTAVEDNEAVNKAQMEAAVAELASKSTAGPIPPTAPVVGHIWLMTPEEHVAMYAPSGWLPLFPPTNNEAVIAGNAFLGTQGLWLAKDGD